MANRRGRTFKLKRTYEIMQNKIGTNVSQTISEYSRQCRAIPVDGRHRQVFLLPQKERKIRQLGNGWIGNRTACIRAPATITGPTMLI